MKTLTVRERLAGSGTPVVGYIWEDGWRVLELQLSGRYEKMWGKLGGEGLRVHRGGRLWSKDGRGG